MRILLIDSDKNLVSSLDGALKQRYITDIALNGEDGSYLSSINSYDLIIIDLNLSDINGFEVCKTIRNGNMETPILVLIDRFEMNYKVFSSDRGFDDYLIKPFNTDDLLERIKELSRRIRLYPIADSAPMLEVADVWLDLDNKMVCRDEKRLRLRRKEFEILEYLMRNKGCVVCKNVLLAQLWKYDSDVAPNALEVHISYLRRKLRKELQVSFIKTVHGFGYKVEV